MLKKLHVFISIISGIIFIIFSLFQNIEPVVIGYRLIFVLIIFYFVGLWARHFLNSNVFTKEEEMELVTEEASADEEPAEVSE